MKLEKLELFGFKSFADKTEFHFKEGVTAIVGPNGSGKSNIVDAFRWILGEQSAKSLRGSEMKDVIFNGTANRKPLGFAEASLHFSNVQDLLGEDQDKLIISRRLYRSGESEYRINGKLSRLKDIKELFAGTGVGFNAYSILEQDKIDKLLSVNPEERRLIFEEAAGISAYRARRKKTERELERTGQYLLRLGDIIGELRSRERSVKIQASRARRYREFTERLKALRLDLYLLKFRGHSERMRDMDEQIEKISGEASRLEGKMRILESELARKESSLHSLGEYLKSVHAQKAQAQTQAAAAEERIRHSKERTEELAARGEALQSDIKVAEEKTGKALSERDRLRVRFANLDSQQAEVEQELKEQRFKIYEASVRIQELEKSQEALRTEGSQALEERSLARNHLATLSEDSERHKANLGRLSARRDKVSGDREELSTLIGKAERELEVKRSEHAKLVRRRQQLQEEMQEAEAEKERLRDERGSLSLDRARRQSRLDTLRALQAKNAGVSAGAQYLLGERGKPGFKQVCGLLGELIEVDIENTALVEAALGRLAEAVVVDTPQTAARLAQDLRKGNCGKAVFVPIKWHDVRRESRDGKRAAELVRCEEPYRRVIERLIGNIYVAENLKDALKASTETRGLRFVTPSGEVAGGGTVLGGSRVSGGIIQRKSEVALLEKELAKIEESLSEVAAAVEKKEITCTRLAQKCTQLDSSIESVSGQVSELGARRGELVRDRSVTETELRTLGVEISSLESLTAQEKAQRAELVRKLKEVEQKYIALQKKLERSQGELEEVRGVKDSLREQLTVLEVKLASVQQECQSVSDSLKAKEGEIEERHQVKDSLEAQVREVEAANAAAKKEAEETSRDLSRLLAEIRRLQDKIRKSEEQYHELDSSLSDLRRQRDEETTKLREVEGRLGEVRIERQACVTQVEDVMEYARQELGIDIEEDIEDILLPDKEPHVLEEEAAQVRQKLQRLGNVNMEALEELEEITARLTFYTNQEQDLLNSKAKLQEVMAKIDRKCRVMLERSFNKIRNNFQVMFRKLFDGGRADIFFEEGEDILEAGISIVAKPPGKHLSSLSLLSGGEKAMTTIALLFAIFKSKLSPFCVLDEIDAPLDDSNVNRFQQLLREFVGECRFLIITHNKQSMAAADALYGITMGEPGVTKRISITFEEAAVHARSELDTANNKRSSYELREDAPQQQKEVEVGEPVLSGAPA